MKDFIHLEPGDYLRIPWNRRWYFLAAMSLAIAGVSIYAWLRPNLYRSETRILVESGTVLDDAMSPNATKDRTEERVGAIRQLLESRSILERIVEEFRLRASDTSIPMEDALRAMRSNLEVSKATGNTFTMAYYATDPQAAQAITRRLAEILIQTNQTSLKNKAIDKDQFMEQELRQAGLELAAIEEKIKIFKAAHLGELPEQGIANMNALNGLNTQLIALDSALDRGRDQQKILEFKLQEQKRVGELVKSIAPKEKPLILDSRGKEPPSAVAMQLITKRALLAEATARYTVKHPDVVRLSKEVEDLEQQLAQRESGQTGGVPSNTMTPLGSTENKQASEKAATGEAATKEMPSQAELSAETEIAQARYELDMLSTTMAKREKERENILRSIGVYQERLKLAPALEQELLSLMREHDAKRQQVANLETRKFNAQMAANAVADRKNDLYRILDEANLPEKPIFPTRLQVILIGLGVSLGVGLAASFGREFLEPSLANEEEAAAVLKIPILVSVPDIPSVPRALLK